MTDTTSDPTTEALSPERLQRRADILENNLFGSIKHSEDNLKAWLHIPRRVSSPPVIVKAIAQILLRFSITSDRLMEDITRALAPPPEAGDHAEFNYKTGREGNTPPFRDVHVRIDGQTIALTITGSKSMEGRNGEIDRFFFDNKRYPGKFRKDGSIDFRELHRFPAVNKGDKLLSVRYKTPGNEGITSRGDIIPIAPVSDLELELEDGVALTEIPGNGTASRGYLVTAGRAGVVTLKGKDDTISSIDVTDNIKLESIDYSVGNIGTEIRSPISIDVGTIHNGFNVTVNGDVHVRNLDGGIVKTDGHAEFDQVRPGSRVIARGDIQARTIARSRLTSHAGTITILRELTDASLTAPAIVFDSPQGLLLNSTLETDNLFLKNVYICGTSTIYLGRELFEKRDALLSEKKSLEAGGREFRQALAAIRSELLEKLRELSRGVSDQSLVPSFKLLIQVLQSLSFKKAFLVLAHLRKHLNVITVDSIVKSFKNLEKLHGKIKEQNRRNAEIDAGIQLHETRIGKMEVVIHGRINTSATIRLFAHKGGPDQEPLHLSSTIQRGKVQAIALSARFSLKDGLRVVRTA